MIPSAPHAVKYRVPTRLSVSTRRRPGFREGGRLGTRCGGCRRWPAGCVLTLALGGDPGGDGQARARWPSPDAAACRAALAALGAMDRAERAHAIAGLLRQARAPVPDGIENVHPGWLRAALESEVTPILRAIVAGLPPEVGAVAREIIAARGEGDAAEETPAIADAPLAELRRAAFAMLVPMPRRTDAEHADAPPWLRLAVLPFPALLAEIERRGATTLGTSLAGAPPAVAARAAASAGARSGRSCSRRRGDRRRVEERERARALVAAAARVAETNVGFDDDRGLAGAGERAGGSAGAAQVIAQRMPPRLGRIMLYPLPRDRPRPRPLVLVVVS